MLEERLAKPLRHHLPPGAVIRFRARPNQRSRVCASASSEELLAAAPDGVGSTGSARHSGEDQPSASLFALGLTSGQAASALRLSLGRVDDSAAGHRATDSLTAALLTSSGCSATTC